MKRRFYNLLGSLVLVTSIQKGFIYYTVFMQLGDDIEPVECRIPENEKELFTTF